LRISDFSKEQPEAAASIDSIIEQCELGQKALSRIEKVQVIDSLIVDKDKFFQYYKLSQETGKLIDFKTLGIADQGEVSAVFENQKGDQRVMSMKNEASGMDLYKSTKLHDNSWSEPVIFPQGINTAANENFPFVLTDGLTIYYSSDAEPTMGGYDLYISKFNSSNDTYLLLKVLSMPFNSPFNDYLFVLDEGNNVGWFASDRYQPKDKVIIYLFVAGPSEKEYYSDLSPEQSVRLAKIASISESWPENANYDDLLHSIYQAENVANDKKGEFLFVVNDNVLYYNYEDFESKEALELFKKYMNAYTQLTDANNELDELRLQWTNSSDNDKASLRSKILQLESRKQNLETQVPDFEVQARNAEINYLKNKK
jgi:WD40-like Beta Propeller Repeat.